MWNIMIGGPANKAAARSEGVLLWPGMKGKGCKSKCGQRSRRGKFCGKTVKLYRKFGKFYDCLLKITKLIAAGTSGC